MREPNGNILDINIAEDVAETGGVETESVIIEWIEARGSLSAEELADLAMITVGEAQDRLINLWENDLLWVDDGGLQMGRFSFPTPEDAPTCP